MNQVIEALHDRQQHSEKYWEENYPDNKFISNAMETDNESWEIGFYAGLQFSIEKIKEITNENCTN